MKIRKKELLYSVLQCYWNDYISYGSSGTSVR